MNYKDKSLLPDVTTVLKRMELLLDELPGQLRGIDPEVFSEKTLPDKWSKKEILGHLCDSAFNNHRRFIKTQYQEIPSVAYEQDEWVKHNHYQNRNQEDVIVLWETMNRHLLHVIGCITKENLMRFCDTGDKQRVTVDWLIKDYLRHLEHHLNQIIRYSF